jgi:hypothetical protein
VENQQLQQAVALSVQSPYPNGYYGAALMRLQSFTQGTLPNRYSPYRQAVLRAMATHPQASMWSGAVAALAKQITSTPWELRGKRRVRFFQEVLLHAQFGAGWQDFVSRLIWDLTTNDDGAVMQIIGRGETNTELPRELVVGLSVLDSSRCYFTGDPEFPVWYQDARTGQLASLHWSRVIRIVDQPMPDPELRGGGLCAMSRASTYVMQNILMNTYQAESLDNMPPAGILMVNGAVPKTWEDVWRRYEEGLKNGRDQKYMPVAQYINPGNDANVSAEMLRFSNAPEGFNPEAMENSQAVGIARALGIDPQDVKPVSGGSFGTNTQARVLDRKASGKMLAWLFKELERAINTRVLPDNLEFKFKPRDAEQGIADAAVANAQVDVAVKLSSVPGIPADTAARYLASTVPALADVLLDENGELLTAHDDDTPEGEGELAAPQLASDATQVVANDAPVTAETAKAFKDFGTTASSFARRFAPILSEINAGGIDNRRRAGILLRSVLDSEGLRAYRDGLAAGGVRVETLDADDMQRYAGWKRQTSGYVTDLTKSLITDGKALTEKQVEQRVDMWINKSLREAYLLGLESADRNGMYVWKVGPTEESCPDCQRLNNQIHRLRDWRRSGWMPGASKLDCKGFECLCALDKTTGSRRGRY